MTERYKLYTVETAMDAGLNAPYNECWDDWDGDILLLYKGNEYVACDGGEPEDNSFARDWRWVVDELNKAYEEGQDSV